MMTVFALFTEKWVTLHNWQKGDSMKEISIIRHLRIDTILKRIETEKWDGNHNKRVFGQILNHLPFFYSRCKVILSFQWENVLPEVSQSSIAVVVVIVVVFYVFLILLLFLLLFLLVFFVVVVGVIVVVPCQVTLVDRFLFLQTDFFLWQKWRNHITAKKTLEEMMKRF